MSTAGPELGARGRRARARLESLITANRAIVAELSLETLLQLVVESAREVVEAQYAALVLTRQDGVIEQVIYSGVDEETQAALHTLAQAGGPLSHLLSHSEAEPARLRMFGASDLLTGVPAPQPLVRSLLAVAIHSSSTLYGNLYLGNRRGAADFDAEDEGLVVALAATAGIAIENARLYDESHRRQQWLSASAAVSRGMLADEGTAQDALATIADHVHRLAPADMVSVVVPVPGVADVLHATVVVGQGADELVGLRYQVHDSIAWQAMQSRRGLVVTDATAREGIYQQVRGVLPANQVMAVPLTGETAVHGAIVLIRTSPSAFSETDRAMVEGFANQATLALELVEARQDRHRLAVLEDRARIARDLHDHVVQKLFAVGLTIQGAARVVGDEVLRQRLTSTVGDLDDTIRSIRTAISQLQEPRSPLPSARSRVRAVLSDLTPRLGFGPIAQFEGPLDTLLDEALVTEVEAVLRASLADIARHGGASTVTVNLTTDGRELRTTVTDDGCPDADRRQGLADLRRRAEQRGGRLDVEHDDEGRLLRWRIPI